MNRYHWRVLRTGLRERLCLSLCLLALSPTLFAQSASQLDKFIAEKRYLELQRSLHSAKLSTEEHDYFSGIVADRTRSAARAIALLERVLPELKKASGKRAAEVLRALGNDYFEAGRYGDAADTYAELLHHYSTFFNEAQRKGFSDNLHTYNLLRGAPRQTVSTGGEFAVATTRDPIGLIEVPLEIGSSKEQWIFDTGANITTIPLSTARRLGLSLSKETAETLGSTAAEVLLHTAIIPEIRFGSAIIRNAVVLVTDDSALDIPLGEKQHFQITGILGYPVMSELGAFTFSNTDAKLTVAPSSATVSSARCAPLYVEELTVLLAARGGDRELVFGFDSGASSGSLTARYLHEFPQQFSTLKKVNEGGAGAGGVRLFEIYQLPRMRLQLGSAAAVMHNVTVNTAPVGNGLLDELYGNLGQGLVTQFRSYTVDFEKMRLCVGEPKPL